jgi:hypothetical protein
MAPMVAWVELEEQERLVAWVEQAEPQDHQVMHLAVA